MGLFGFLKKDSQPEPSFQEVRLQELPQWYESVRSAELGDKRQEAERLHNSLADSFSSIKESLDSLDKARVTGAERLHISANMIKETFVKKKYQPVREVFSFRENFRHDYGYFLAFQEQTMKALEEMKASTPKQMILLGRYFKKESQALVDAMKQAEQASLQFRDYLKTGSGSLRTLARIRQSVRQAREAMVEIDKLDLRIKSLEKQIRDSRERKASQEKEYLKLLKSKDWNKMNKIEAEVKSAREALRQAEVRLNTELSSLKKPLKKIEHIMVNKGKLSPIHRNNLRDFLLDPMKFILAEKEESTMARTMEEVGKQLKKLDMTTEYDTETLKERFDKGIPEIKKAYLDAREKLEKKQFQFEELSRLSESKQGIEEEVRKSSEAAGSLDDQLRDLRAEKAGKEKEVQETIRDLESMIKEESQRFVTIKT